MNTEIYNGLTKDVCMSLLIEEGALMDEVVIFGLVKMKIFSLHNFYVQAVYTKNEDLLLDVKALISDEDWKPYLETLDLSDFIA